MSSGSDARRLDREVVFIHPPMPDFENALSEKYEFAHWPASPETAARIRAAAALGGVGFSDEMLSALVNRKLIAAFGIGTDKISSEYCKSHGITVTNTPSVGSDDVADQALALLLAIAKRIVENDSDVRTGTWRGLLDRPLGSGLMGNKAGIVGMGEIGTRIAARLEAFGMTVSWHGPRDKPLIRYPYQPNLLRLAADVQWLILCAPSLPSTRRMIDADILEALGPQGALVNAGRGDLVDEEALIAALRNKRIAGAGLDVFEQEPTPFARWASLRNVVLSPHVGGATIDAMRQGRAIVSENLRLFFEAAPTLTSQR